ncbi:MAG: hypothetical protein WCT77_14195 [Bacteroidota bacterium]|jgi:hypothetical protein
MQNTLITAHLFLEDYKNKYPCFSIEALLFEYANSFIKGTIQEVEFKEIIKKMPNVSQNQTIIK